MHIELQHIHKRFGAVHANNDITLTFAEGRVLGVLGENGAGKSTLMKILSGYQQADSGDILIDGRHARLHSPQAAIRHGIGMLQQDPLDVGAFSVLENFLYGAPGGLRMNKRQARAALSALCTRFNFEIAPEKPVSTLSIAQRQQLEILRQLSLGVRTLILDEPTTGISEDQKKLLFDTLRGLAHDEGMTILLVSHKLEDVISLCDAVVVLRAGRVVGMGEMPLSKAALVRMMFESTTTMPAHTTRTLDAAPVIMDLEHVALQVGRVGIAPVSLRVRQGEVIGLAGLDGSGQELLMRACAGLLRPAQGQIRVGGVLMNGQSYPRFLAAGVVFGAAGRLEEGLIAGLTLTEHLTLVQQRGLLIDYSAARQYTQEQIARFNIRGRADSRIETLSGGNQQRVLMALLPPDARLLVLQQPTRGLDVDSAAWIWEQLEARRSKGTAILFSSADLDEIIAYSDRVLVFYAGRATLVENTADLTVNVLGHYIGGELAPSSQEVPA